MKAGKRVAFATGSRADYGIVRRYLSMLEQEPSVDLVVLVTGALLEDTFGHQVDLIEEDGFSIGARIPLSVDPSSEVAVAHSMALALEGFSSYFASNACDLLIVLGDRYEMLGAAVAAAMQRIPILHLHGGEATYANYDEFIRHSITKMSLYHFTATEEYRRRVIQLGEAPDRVFNMGALGAENCVLLNRENDSPTDFQVPSGSYFVVLFHPETISGHDPAKQIGELLTAVERVQNHRFVFIGSNADTHSDVIRRAVKDFAASHANACYYENLRSAEYQRLVSSSVGLIGNSSSGLIEAPSLGANTVNIGHRQDGRVRGASVVDVPCDSESIYSAMDLLTKRAAPDPLDNPYYHPNAARNYFDKTMELLGRIDADASAAKPFYDLPLRGIR